MIAFMWRLLAAAFRGRRKLAELPPMARIACAEMSRATLDLRGRWR